VRQPVPGRKASLCRPDGTAPCGPIRDRRFRDSGHAPDVMPLYPRLQDCGHASLPNPTTATLVVARFTNCMSEGDRKGRL
jgi:hypothetical protein